MYKNHEAPEFQVIKQNEANAKFFVASETFNGTPDPSSPLQSTMSYTKQSGNSWF